MAALFNGIKRIKFEKYFILGIENSDYFEQFGSTKEIDANLKEAVMYSSAVLGSSSLFLLFFKLSKISKFLIQWPEKYLLILPSLNTEKYLKIINFVCVIFLLLCSFTVTGFNLSMFPLNFSLPMKIIYAFGTWAVSTAIYIGHSLATIFHISFCYFIYRLYQEMINFVKKIKIPNYCNEYDYYLKAFQRMRLQHQKVIAGTDEFMGIFGLIELLIFTDIVILGAILVYQITYLIINKENETIFNVWYLFSSLVWMVAKVWPLFAFCISSDAVISQVEYICL